MLAALWRGALRAIGYGLLALVSIAVLLAFKPVPVTVPPIQAGPDVGYWQMPGGYRIAYHLVPANGIAAGSARTTPILFLHGGPGGYVHSAHIRALAPLSAGGRAIYLYDQSGTGLSDRRARPKETTLASHVADLNAIVTGPLGASKVVLIGHSYGAQVATGFAVRHPELVEHLVLTSPGAIQPIQFDEDGRSVNEQRYPTPPGLSFRAIDVDGESSEDLGIGGLPFRALASIALATAFDMKFAPDAELDAALNTMAARFTRHMVCDPAKVQPEEGGAGAYSRIGANFYEDSDDPRALMPAMTAPVLVLQGACDYIPYADAYEYAALFPNARYRFVPDAGHILWWEKPDEVRAAIGEFLDAPVPERPAPSGAAAD